MATMAMDMVKKNNLATLFAVSSLISTPALAGEFKFTPSFTIDETYSDNVERTLTDEVSSLVSQAGVNLSTQYLSKLISFNLSSKSIYALYSHDHDLDNDYHSFNSDFRIKLGEDGFSLFGSANMSNQARNASRNSLADIVSADTVRVENYTGGLAYDVSNSRFIINTNISYQLRRSQDDIGNNKGYVSSFNFQNGTGARSVFWQANGNYLEQNNRGNSSRIYQGEAILGVITSWKLNPFIRYYDEDNKGNINRSQPNESNSYGVGLRWLVTPRLYIDVSYNKPIGNKLDIDGNELENYIGTSINWQPSTRTKLEASFSQRFFGDSYSLNLTHRNKRLTNSIVYSENIQSFTRNNFNPIEIGSYWCPIGESSNLNNCFVDINTNINFENFQLLRFFDYELIEDNTLSLNKSINWSTELKLARTTFSFNLNRNTRENLESRTEDERSTFTLSASRRVSGKSSINLTASYTDNIFQLNTDNERQDRYRQVSIGYRKSLNSNLSFNFDLANVNRSSEQQQFNYEEGRVTFKITKDF